MMNGLNINEDELGLDAIRDVGPGGHYFGTEHTMSRYKTAFYSPMVSDWRNFESWTEAGSPTALHKANTVYKRLLKRYQPPELDPAGREELEAFVAKRVEAGGVETDF